MDQLNWIFEESSGSNQYSGSLWGNGSSKRRQSSMDELTDYEREELDYVTALSLSEEDIRKREPIAVRWLDKDDETSRHVTELEDEYLAMAVMESLNMPSPQHDQGNAIRTSEILPTSKNKHCKGCNARIWEGEKFLRCNGAAWHHGCFKCQACHLPITSKKFSSFKEDEDHPFHESCFEKLHYPKCDICKNSLPLSTGVVEYGFHPFWMQKYCKSHEQDDTSRCCSCERMEPRDMPYMALDDVRKLCLECVSSAIMNSEECQPLYREVREFYKGLNMEVKQDFPLLLVEREALNEAMKGEQNGHHHLPETMGVCLTEERTVPSVVKNLWLESSLITEPYELAPHCEVTAILILYGFPRLLTGSIVAHEMMHAWLRLSGYSKLSQEVEEGICQVMAHMWLDAETDPHSEQLLRKFFKHQIEVDKSPVYGKGFRAGHSAVQKFGLKRTLYHIRMTGSFPL